MKHVRERARSRVLNLLGRAVLRGGLMQYAKALSERDAEGLTLVT